MVETAIKVRNVYKDFRLPHNQASTIKGAFTGLLKGNFSQGEYETQHALKDISFEVKKGEFFGIVGRNGSGKSTLLKLIAGIYQPTRGTVTTKGRIVPFIELGVGFNAELSGKDNVYLNGAILGFDKSEVEKKYEEIVTFAELERFMDQKLKNYSSGMQVRLAFSVATILAKSDILLIDEVLAVGDASFQRKCYEYFSELKKTNKTVIFVTHDMNAVRQYCDRAMLIDQNEVVAIGDPDTISKSYTHLFMQQEESPQAERKDQKRWGDGSVAYKSVSLELPKARSDKSIRIKCSFKAKKDVRGVIPGFSVKNAANETLFGTNTQIKQIKPFDMRAGDQYSLSWTVPDIFNDGKYFVDLAVVYSNGVDVGDWWEEAKTFTLAKEENTPYNVNPQIEVELVKK